VVRSLAAQNIHAPFAVQSLVLEDALAGIDILAASPTGSGKTLAFGLPLVERTAKNGQLPGALVLVPTRELASQVVDDLRPHAAAKGLRIAADYGGTSVSQQAKRAKDANILVATPGRLFDLIERRLVRLDGVRTLVLDEADRMLDMGFKPQVDRILKTVSVNRQTMLFSATLDGPVQELAQRYTANAVRYKHTPAETNLGTIEHEFVPVTAEGKIDRLVEQLGDERGLALVFVRTKHGADKLARKLTRQHEVPAVVMHGNMTQNARERSLAQFQSGKVPTLIATDVAARGLDVDDITHVINYDPPHTDDDYVHRTGRTGRAGRSGTGVTFVLPEQQTDVGKLAQRLGHGAAFAASGMKTAQSARPARQRNRRGARR
jgi:superfamily II DNA/RNA helicase